MRGNGEDSPRGDRQCREANAAYKTNGNGKDGQKKQGFKREQKEKEIKKEGSNNGINLSAPPLLIL